MIYWHCLTCLRQFLCNHLIIASWWRSRCTMYLPVGSWRHLWLWCNYITSSDISFLVEPLMATCTQLRAVGQIKYIIGSVKNNKRNDQGNRRITTVVQVAISLIAAIFSRITVLKTTHLLSALLVKINHVSVKQCINCEFVANSVIFVLCFSVNDRFIRPFTHIYASIYASSCSRLEENGWKDI